MPDNVPIWEETTPVAAIMDLPRWEDTMPVQAVTMPPSRPLIPTKQERLGIINTVNRGNLEHYEGLNARVNKLDQERQEQLKRIQNTIYAGEPVDLKTVEQFEQYLDIPLSWRGEFMQKPTKREGKWGPKTEIPQDVYERNVAQMRADIAARQQAALAQEQRIAGAEKIAAYEAMPELTTQLTESSLLGDIQRTTTQAGLGLAEMATNAALGIMDVNKAVPTPQFIKTIKENIGATALEDKARKALEATATNLAMYRKPIADQIAEEGGLPATIAQNIGEQMIQNAVLLAGLGITPIMGKAATTRTAVANAAKMAGISFVQTPGTVADKAQAAAHSGLFMLTPIPASKLPSDWTARLVNIVENIGIDALGTAAPAYQQAKQDAKTNGTTVATELAKYAIPALFNDTVFGLMGTSAKGKGMVPEAERLKQEFRTAIQEEAGKRISPEVIKPGEAMPEPTRIPFEPPKPEVPKPTEEVPRAKETRAEIEASSSQQELVAGTEGRLRVRDTTADRVEAGAGAEPPPPKPRMGEQPPIREVEAAKPSELMTPAEAGSRIEKIGSTGVFYRTGAPPKEGRSFNFQKNEYEKGVSVYRTPHPSSVAGFQNKPWYRIEGEIIAYGADNEPLVRVIKIQKLSEAKLDVERQKTNESWKNVKVGDFVTPLTPFPKGTGANYIQQHSHIPWRVIEVKPGEIKIQAEGYPSLVPKTQEFSKTDFRTDIGKPIETLFDFDSRFEIVKLPEGYVHEGDRYVFKGKSTPTIKESLKIEKPLTTAQMLNMSPETLRQKARDLGVSEELIKGPRMQVQNAIMAMQKITAPTLEPQELVTSEKAPLPPQTGVAWTKNDLQSATRSALEARGRELRLHPTTIKGPRPALMKAIEEKQKIVAPMAVIPTTMRPIDKIMDEKAQKAHADLSKEATGGFISIFLGRKPKPIGGVQPVSEVLEAGRRYPPGPISKIAEKAQAIGRTFAENFTSFMRRNKANPQFIDDWRTQAMPLRDQQMRKVLNWRFATFGKLYKHEGRDGTDRAMDIIFTKDLIVRGESGLDLPNDIKVSDLKQHLMWLESTSSAEAKDAASTIRQIIDAQGRELSNRGKIGEPRKEYAPHVIMEYEPEWMKQRLAFPMKTKFGEPYRGYTRQAVGSKQLIRTDQEGLWTHIFKVEMDNTQEDMMLRFANQYDVKSQWAKQAEQAGQAAKLRKGQVVKFDGKDYEAIEWKKTFFKATAVDDAMLKQAVEDDALVNEWLEMRGPKGGKPIRPTIAVGKPKLFLVPKEIAYQLKNMTEKSPDVFNLAYELGRATQTWKKFTLGTAGIQYHIGNMLGDTMNTVLFDPAALPYLWSAQKVAKKVFLSPDTKLNPFEEELLKLSTEKDVAASGQYAGELRKYGSLTRLGEKYEQLNGYRESINRLAILAHQLARIQNGKKVQRVAGINLEGLDQRSAAGKVARESLVDYTAVPRAYTLLLSRGATPFLRFHEANARNHLRAAFRTPESALKYWLPTLTAYGASFAWNNTGNRKEDEMALPDWVRNRLHLVFGRDKEDKIVVWAPQVPPDMAWSWVGVDNIPRILSDKKNGRIKTWPEAGKEYLKALTSGAPKNIGILLSPAIQVMKGLHSNSDPFTGRKVMPDDIFKIWKESSYSNAVLDKRTRGYVVNYIIEKLVSPIAQYTRLNQETEPVDHPIFDLLIRSTIGLGRAIGIRKLDPMTGVMEQHRKTEIDMQATRAYWRAKLYDVLRDYGADEKRIVELQNDAPSEDNISGRITDWMQKPQARLVIIGHALRTTKDEIERVKLLKKKADLIRDINQMSVEEPK